jgi:hypothetical protein
MTGLSEGQKFLATAVMLQMQDLEQLHESRHQNMSSMVV